MLLKIILTHYDPNLKPTFPQIKRISNITSSLPTLRELIFIKGNTSDWLRHCTFAGYLLLQLIKAVLRHE